MQQGKLRGSNRKMSMPMGPFRTHSVPVNVGRLDVFDAGSTVDLEALAAKGLVKNNANRDWPVKILAQGEIDRALTVRVARRLRRRRERRSRPPAAPSRSSARPARPSRGEAMLKTILTSLRSPDLRKKLLFTAFILLVYRFGSYVPVPGDRPRGPPGGDRRSAAAGCSTSSTCSPAAR